MVWIAAPSLHAANVERGQDGDHDHRHEPLGREAELNGVRCPGKAYLAERKEDIGRDAGNEHAEEPGEGDRDGGDGAGLDHREEGPAEQEARRAALALAKEDVLPPGLASSPPARHRRARR